MNSLASFRRAFTATGLTVALLSGTSAAVAAPGDISTIAGTVPPLGYKTKLTWPAGVTYDALGNFYIAEGGSNRIRKQDTSGRLTTIAGTGVAGFSGDGGPAREAQFNNPSDVALDAAGNLFIADRGNQRIRKINTLGKISTIAGNGTAGFTGDGGPATASKVSTPMGLAIDTDGSLLIADRNNGRIRRIDPAGTISTIVGTGPCGYFGDAGPADQARLCLPSDITLDGSGSLFIADTYNSVIRKVTAGIITTVAGNTLPYYFGDGLPATLASLNWPSQVDVDNTGNIFIADTGNQRVRKIDTAGTISTVAGASLDGSGAYAGDGGQATAAYLRNPRGIAANHLGIIAISDTDNHRIRMINLQGVIGTAIGGGTASGCDYTGNGAAATSATLCLPAGITADAAGNTYFADRLASRIRKVSAAGVITTIAGTGTIGYTGDGGPATAALLHFPEDVALDAAGNLYIADTGNGRIRMITPAGVISTFAGGGVDGSTEGIGPLSAAIQAPRGVAIGPSGELYLSESGGKCRVRKIASGAINTVAGDGRFPCGFMGDGGTATLGRMNNPGDIAVDSAGTLYIVDRMNHRIRKVSSGIISTFAGTGVAGFSGDGGAATSAQVSAPRGVLVDAAGNVWIADTDNNRIRVVDTTGTITSVAGAGTAGDASAKFSGDGGPASAALLSYPSGMAFDSAGHLLVTDTLNNRVRRIQGPF